MTSEADKKAAANVVAGGLLAFAEALRPSAIDKLRKVLDDIDHGWHTAENGREARAALDELARENTNLAEAYHHAKVRAALAQQKAEDLESQLPAQPKALEWREPSTAPSMRVVFTVRESGVLGYGWCNGAAWFSEVIDPEPNQGGAWVGDVVGWLPLSALPPAPKGGSDG